MRVADVETLEELSLERVGFVLTLEGDPDASYARGSIRILDSNLTYPIQSNAAFLDALIRYLSRIRRSD